MAFRIEVWTERGGWVALPDSMYECLEGDREWTERQYLASIRRSFLRYVLDRRHRVIKYDAPKRKKGIPVLIPELKALGRALAK